MQDIDADQSLTLLRQVLLGAGLERYFEVFAQNNLDVELLGELTDEEFASLGVQSLGHRVKLRKIVRESTSVRAADAPLDQAAISDTPAKMFKRQVVVLFVDLVGFTSLSTRYSGEDMVRLMTTFFHRVDGVIDSFDGRVNKHMGDCSIAVFGLEGASGHEAENAIAAATEIHRRLAEPIPGLENALHCHIGVASGQVVIQLDGAVEDYAITGNSMNLASRLSDLAEAEKTLISDRIFRQLSGHIDCSEPFSVSVKGFPDPITVRECYGLTANSPDEAFVGRATEVYQFATLMERCALGAGAVIAVKGEAGIGKSSLVKNLMQMAAQHQMATVTAMVLDFGASQNAHPVSAIACGLLSCIDGSEAEPERVIEALHAHGRIDSRQRMFSYLCAGLTCPKDLRAAEDALDAPARKRGIAEAMRSLVLMTTERTPVVIIVEDMHWSDRFLRDLAAQLARLASETQLLLVFTTRPAELSIDDELRDERGLAVNTLDLGALDETASHDLVERMAGDVAPELVALCLDRAKGNPLFLKQLLAHVEESRVSDVPDSIQSIVQSRMDQLTAQDRQLIEAAAILGQRFSFDAVQWVSERTDVQLSPIVRAGLVQRRPEDFVFSHALIRDSVLDLMLSDRKASLHLRAAEWMRGTDRELHAEHLERAGDPGAAAAFLEAAKELQADARPDPALALVDRVFALSPPADVAWNSALLRAALLLDKGHSEEAIEAYQEATDSATEPEDRCKAMIGQIATMRVVDRIDEAHALLDQAEALALAAELPNILSEIHYYRGALFFPAGKVDACLEAHSQSVRQAEIAGSPLLKAQALSGLGDAHYAQGRMRTAHRAISECLELAATNGFAKVEAANRFMLATVRIYLNETEAALHDALMSVKLSETTGAYRPEIVSRLTAGWILISKNAFEDAKDQIERGRERAREVGAKRFEPFLCESLARVQLLEGNRAEAMETIRQAVQDMREGGERFIGPWILGSLARITDDAEERAAALTEGEDLLKKGCVGHNYFRFYHAGIATGTDLRDVGLLDRYSMALADYTAQEPVPWSDYYIRRARLFAAILEERDTPAILSRELAEVDQIAQDAGFQTSRKLATTYREFLAARL